MMGFREAARVLNRIWPIHRQDSSVKNHTKHDGMFEGGKAVLQGVILDDSAKRPTMASSMVDLLSTPILSITETENVVVFGDWRLELDNMPLMFEVGPTRIAGYAGNARSKREYILACQLLSPADLIHDGIDLGPMPPVFFRSPGRNPGHLDGPAVRILAERRLAAAGRDVLLGDPMSGAFVIDLSAELGSALDLALGIARTNYACPPGLLALHREASCR